MKTVISYILKDYSCFARDSKTRTPSRTMVESSEESSKDYKHNRQLFFPSSLQEWDQDVALMEPNGIWTDIKLNPLTNDHRTNTVPSFFLLKDVYIEEPSAECSTVPVSRVPLEEELVRLKGNTSPSCSCDVSVESGLTRHTHSSEYTIGLQFTKHSAVASLTDVYNNRSLSSIQYLCDSSVESSLPGNFGEVEFEWESDMEEDMEKQSSNACAGSGHQDHTTTIKPVKETMAKLQVRNSLLGLERSNWLLDHHGNDHNCSSEQSCSSNLSDFSLDLRSCNRPSAVSSVTGVYEKLFKDCSRKESSLASALEGSTKGAYFGFEDEIEESSVETGSIDDDVARVQALILQIK